MTPYQNAISKLEQLPEPLIQEVNQFIDALLQSQKNNASTVQNLESYPLMKLAETGFTEWNDPEEDIYNDVA